MEQQQELQVSVYNHGIVTQVFIIYFLRLFGSLCVYLSGRYGKENNGKMCMVCISKGGALCCGYCDCMNLRNLMGLLGKQALEKGDWREIKQLLLWVREKAVRPIRVMHA